MTVHDSADVASAEISDSCLVDLRSDTQTQPTPEMRRAMAEAVVGDDGYGEDPTVTALQEEFAARLGKERALYVPSGTMANQVAIAVLSRPGSIVLAGRRSHLVAHENGASPANSGVQLHQLDDEGGHLQPAAVEWVAAAAAHHQPTPSLLCIENTYMPADGAALSLEETEELVAVAAKHDLAVHLDGARLWNAEVATGVSAAQLAAGATTVMCCLSKGLCAPVGSVLAGPADVIAEARVHRQRFGGGMRQAGIIAAAGLVAMRTMVQRLADDHRRAAILREVVAERWPANDAEQGDGAGGNRATFPTNIVTFRSDAPDELIAHLRGAGVLSGTVAPGVMRLVTHHDVDDAGIERAVAALRSYTGR